MRRFVRHDVERQAGEHHAAPLRHVTEEQSLVMARIECVGVGERMRRDVELVPPRAQERPWHVAPEGGLELPERGHRDGIDILRVKARVGDQPLDVCDMLELVAPGGKLVGRVVVAGAGVEIHHPHAVPVRPGRRRLLGQADARRERRAVEIGD